MYAKDGNNKNTTTGLIIIDHAAGQYTRSACMYVLDGVGLYRSCGYAGSY